MNAATRRSRIALFYFGVSPLDTLAARGYCIGIRRSTSRHHPIFGLAPEDFAFILKMLLAVTLVVNFIGLSAQKAPEPLAPLKFAEDGTFQISILEDLHFGESKLAEDSNTLKLH